MKDETLQTVSFMTLCIFSSVVEIFAIFITRLLCVLSEKNTKNIENETAPTTV